MKKEESQKVISLDEKAKFFALYWGQKVLCYKYSSHPLPMEVSSRSILCSQEETSFLILKPLSSISDEDESFIENNILGKDSKVQLRRYLNDSVSAHISLSKTITIIDYLRSKGYAMTWLGITVEEQVNRGWVKLKGE